MARYKNNQDLGAVFGDVFGLLLQYQQMKNQNKKADEALDIQRQDLAINKAESTARIGKYSADTARSNYDLLFEQNTEPIRTKILENQNLGLIAGIANTKSNTAINDATLRISDIQFQGALIDMNDKVFALQDKYDAEGDTLLATQSQLLEKGALEKARVGLDSMVVSPLYDSQGKPAAYPDDKARQRAMANNKYKIPILNTYMQDAFPGMPVETAWEADRMALVGALQKVTPEQYVKRGLDTPEGQARFFREEILNKRTEAAKASGRGQIRAGLVGGGQELTIEKLQDTGYVKSLWGSAEDHTKFKKVGDLAAERLESRLRNAELKSRHALEITKIQASDLSPEKKILAMREFMVKELSSPDASEDLRGLFANHAAEQSMKEKESPVIRNASVEDVDRIISGKFLPTSNEFGRMGTGVGVPPSPTPVARKTNRQVMMERQLYSQRPGTMSMDFPVDPTTEQVGRYQEYGLQQEMKKKALEQWLDSPAE
jgi:hypothetical protein